MAGDKQTWLESQAEFYCHKLQEGREVFDTGPYATMIRGEWLRFIKNFMFDGAAILDVGCGDGWQSRWLAEQGAGRVVALDLTPGFIVRARSLTPAHLLDKITYVCCAVEDYRSEPTFDVVVMKDVFEHLFEPQKAMETIADLITESSIVLIETCNRRRLRNTLWRLVGRSKISPAHFREYTPGELTEILQESGFAVDEMVGLGFLPGLGRLRKGHEQLFALDLWLGQNVPGLAGGIMAACKKAQVG